MGDRLYIPQQRKEFEKLPGRVGQIHGSHYMSNASVSG